MCVPAWWMLVAFAKCCRRTYTHILLTMQRAEDLFVDTRATSCHRVPPTPVADFSPARLAAHGQISHKILIKVSSSFQNNFIPRARAATMLTTRRTLFAVSYCRVCVRERGRVRAHGSSFQFLP